MYSLLQLSFIAIVAASPLSTYPFSPPVQRTQLAKAPVLDQFHPHGTINDSYIVVLKPGLAPALKANHFNFLQSAHYADPLEDVASGIRHVYDHIDGYAGRFTQGVLEKIRALPDVAYIERDQVVKAIDTQKSAPWGLARISHRPRLTFSTFTKYVYDPRGGSGVDVYVIDTGIHIAHAEFEGRAKWGTTIPKNEPDLDENGHGTHCAGTIGSRKWGVAKNVNLVAVKVLGAGGSGSLSDVIAGVQWASQAAADKAKRADEEGDDEHKGSVSNMSLGSGESPSLDAVVNAAVDRGMHFAVAAGNDNSDACRYSPARAEKAVTVAASTLADERAYFSNWGTCVDVFAPGLNILSAWIGSDHASATLSGTSMASPHTAGVLAYLLSLTPSKSLSPFTSSPLLTQFQSQERLTNPRSLYTFIRSALPSYISGFLPAPESERAPVPPRKRITPAELKRLLIGLSTPGVVAGEGKGTPNLLVFNNATDALA